MGRLAELFEKKANGTITTNELQEFEQLQKEAKMLESVGTETKTEQKIDDDEEVERLAKTMADSMSKGLDAKIAELTDVSKKLDKFFTEQESQNVSTNDRSKGFIFDNALGKKVSVAELSEKKIALPSRKLAGNKSVTEISMKTVHFIQALAQKNVEKLQILSEGTAADGGYLVPDEFANLIIEDARDLEVMRTISRPAITISSDTFHLPNLATRPIAMWRNEKAAKNTSTATFGENVFTPYSVAVIVSLSNELVSDASLGVGASIVNYVADLMAKSIAETEEKAFWVGTGSSQPSGVDGGVYSLRTVAASAATDVARADAIISGFQRTPQGYRSTGVWVANSTTWESIARLKDGDNNYLLSNLANTSTQTLRGRPVFEQNSLAGGTLLYGDFSQAYQIVDREGISVRVSDEATVAGYSGFERNLTHVRVEKRVDGEVVLQNAITKITGMGVI